MKLKRERRRLQSAIVLVFVFAFTAMIVPVSGATDQDAQGGDGVAALEDIPASGNDTPLDLQGITTSEEFPYGLPHAFYGYVLVNNTPAGPGLLVEAEGPGVITNTSDNPVTTNADGSYGGSDLSQVKLTVQGTISPGTPLVFFVNGNQAEVFDDVAGIWKTSYPFQNGEITELNLRIPSQSENGTPVPDFSANHTYGPVDLTVQFTDMSTNTPTAWAWDFGDGITSSDQNPVHTYTSNGIYNVSLAATNANGTTIVVKNSYIQVVPLIGGDKGYYLVHCNIDGAEVYFDEDAKGIITNGTLLVSVYLTATPYQNYSVSKEGYVTVDGPLHPYPAKDQTRNINVTLVDVSDNTWTRLAYPEVTRIQPGYPDTNWTRPPYPEVTRIQPGYPDTNWTRPPYPEVTRIQPGYPDTNWTHPPYPEVTKIQPGYPDTNWTRPPYPEVNWSRPGFPDGSDNENGGGLGGEEDSGTYTSDVVNGNTVVGKFSINNIDLYLPTYFVNVQGLEPQQRYWLFYTSPSGDKQYLATGITSYSGTWYWKDSWEYSPDDLQDTTIFMIQDEQEEAFLTLVASKTALESGEPVTFTATLIQHNPVSGEEAPLNGQNVYLVDSDKNRYLCTPGTNGTYSWIENITSLGTYIYHAEALLSSKAYKQYPLVSSDEVTVSYSRPTELRLSVSEWSPGPNTPVTFTATLLQGNPAIEKQTYLSDQSVYIIAPDGSRNLCTPGPYGTYTWTTIPSSNTYTCSAVFDGTDLYHAAASYAMTVKPKKATSLTISASNTNPNPGEEVTFTATLIQHDQKTGNGTPLSGREVFIAVRDNLYGRNLWLDPFEHYQCTPGPNGTYSCKIKITSLDNSYIAGFNGNSEYADAGLSNEERVVMNLSPLIETYGPTLVFHPDEQFYLDNVDYILPESQVILGLVENEGDYNNFKFVILGVTQNYAETHTAMSNFDSYLMGKPQAYMELKYNDRFRYFVNIPEALKPGNLSRATTYVRVLPVNDDSVDLQFWFYYPYNGYGNAHANIGDIDLGYFSIQSGYTGIGRHYSDWEHVTLRFDISENTPKLQSMYFAQHAGGYWYNPDELTYEGSHPIVYVGRFTHASYPNGQLGVQVYKDNKEHIDWGIGHLDVDLCDFTAHEAMNMGMFTIPASKGKEFRTWTDGGAEIFSSALPGVYEPYWLGFKGRWGQYEKNNLVITVGDIAPKELYINPVTGTILSIVKDKKPVDEWEVNPGPTGPSRKEAFDFGDIDGPPVP